MVNTLATHHSVDNMSSKNISICHIPHLSDEVLMFLMQRALPKLCDESFLKTLGIDVGNRREILSLTDINDVNAPLHRFLRTVSEIEHPDDKKRHHRSKSMATWTKASRKLMLMITRRKWVGVIRSFLDADDERGNSDFIIPTPPQYLDDDDDNDNDNDEIIGEEKDDEDEEEDDKVEDDIEEEDDKEEDDRNEGLAVDENSESTAAFPIEKCDEIRVRKRSVDAILSQTRVDPFVKQCLDELPQCTVERFGEIGFMKWGKKGNLHLPVLILSPLYAPSGRVRDQWLSNFKKYKSEGTLSLIPNLVYWYGSKSLKQAFSFAPNMSIVPFEEGCERQYHILPENVSRSPTCKMRSKKLKVFHCTAIAEMEEDACFKSANERVPHIIAESMNLEFGFDVHAVHGISGESNTDVVKLPKDRAEGCGLAGRTTKRPTLANCHESNKLRELYQALGERVEQSECAPSQFDPPILTGKGHFCQASRLFGLLLKFPRRLAGVAYRNLSRYQQVTKEGRCIHLTGFHDETLTAEQIGEYFFIDPMANKWPPGFDKIKPEQVILLDKEWIVQRPTGKRKECVCVRASFPPDRDQSKSKMFAHLVCEMECKETLNQREGYIQTLEDCTKIKGCVKRGKKRADLSELYMCFGFRFAYKGTRLECYTYKKGNKEQHDCYNVKVGEIMGSLWKIAFRKIDPDDLNAMLSAADLTNFSKVTLNSSGMHSQFAASLNYTSHPHIDADGLVGVLAVFDRKKPTSREIITHFLFPESKMAFPLISGDILVFDPRVTHCCCNPRNNDAFVCSAYTSAKTVHAHIAQWMYEMGMLD